MGYIALVSTFLVISVCEEKRGIVENAVLLP